MLVSTIIPVPHPIPTRAVVRTVYATAINPYTQQPQQVRVLWVEDRGLPNPVKIADVRGLTAILGYSVPAASLKNISFFVTLEVE